MQQPVLREGHVAAWLGAGDGKTWLQVGLSSSFPYVETGRYKDGAAVQTSFQQSPIGWPIGEAHVVGVRAAGGGRWRAFLDGQPVGPAVSLRTDRVSVKAVGENYTETAGTCNAYGYRMQSLRVSHDGRWNQLARSAWGRFRSTSGYRLSWLSGSTDAFDLVSPS